MMKFVLSDVKSITNDKNMSFLKIKWERKA